MWSPVTPDVAELKAWSRRAWWTAHEKPRQKARALVELASTPWRFARETTRVFPEYAPFVSRHFGASKSRQLRDLIWARTRYGLDPIAYYRFQLFRPERWKRASGYVQNADTGRLLRWLVARTSGYVSVFGDKRAFEAWCVEQGLPTVRTLMVFERGQVTRGQSPDGALPPIDLFSKPSNGQGGEATTRWTYRTDDSYAASDGRVCDARGLIAELARMSTDLGRPVLLQPALRNARCDAALTPAGLCTARMTTVRFPGDEPQLLFAIYRMPADAAAAADNFSSGGLSSPVDLATGRLLPALRKDFRLHPEPVDRHPQTGVHFVGHQLPHWAEAVNLVLRANRAVTWKGVPVIGWDVALLEEGPILVEGNNIPCSTFAQMVLEQPLGDSPIVACLNAHLRECFAPASARS
jgi:hypothetical protein